MKTIRTIGAPLSLAILLAACGGGNDGTGQVALKDPLEKYKSQVVQWGSCDHFLAQGDGGIQLHAAALGDRLRCADIKAPLDYNEPENQQITLSVMRVLAADSPDKKPNLLFNPGGPGGDGQIYSLYYSMLLANGRQDTALGKKYLEMSDSYNFLGFSPRGVGASTNISCTGNERVYQNDLTKWGKTSENIKNITDYARYIATNCQKNPVSAHIHTDATARDMDLMRHLLGDEKLHYYGISYGTWLGLWYAGIFPDRVGPMILDSSMNFNQSIHDAGISFKLGTVHTFLNHTAPYAARHDNVFGLGKTAQEVINNLNSINHEVNWALLSMNEIANFRAEPENIKNSLVAIKVATETQKLINQNKALSDIKIELTNKTYINNQDMDFIFKKMVTGDQGSNIRSMIDGIDFFRNPQFSSISSSFDHKAAVFDTVVCNDEPLTNKDQSYWIDIGFSLANELPIVGNSTASQPCIYWKRQQEIKKPTMDKLKNAPVLMLQSQFDVPTPLVGAMETFDLLQAANMVYIKNEGSHGLLMYGTECVDMVVTDYLLGRQPAKRLTECENKPLPLDASMAQLSAKKSPANIDPDLAHFKDAELARKLLSQLRKSMH